MQAKRKAKLLKRNQKKSFFSLCKEDCHKFWRVLSPRKLIGLNFGLVLISLLFLPAETYYQSLRLTWKDPQVLGSHFVIPIPALYPQKVTAIEPPPLTAQGVMVLDPTSSVRLLEKNPAGHFLPASTTKIMTALVSLDNFRSTDILTVPKLEDMGQDIKLVEDEKMTFENLLYALMVASANDAAETLATNFPGGRDAFIEGMNRKAAMLYLKDSHFANPTGVDQVGHYVSPYDLAMLAKYSLRNSLFVSVVKTREIVLSSVDSSKAHKIDNLNQLLGKVEGVEGIKTGWTESAGECLVTYVNREGKKIIVVVLGSQDRFGETVQLINWVYGNFGWAKPTFDN